MVTCGGFDCSVCSLLKTIQNLLDWLLGISAALAVLCVVVAGFIYLANWGNKDLFVRAKRFLIYSVGGFIIVLISFLAFNALYLILGADNKQSWFRIDCSLSEPVKSENQNVERIQIKNIDLSVVNGNTVYASIADTQKVTKLNLSNFDPYNLLLDSINLNTGQELNFIVSKKNQNFNDVLDGINESQGFSSQTIEDDSPGNRMVGSSSTEKVLTIKKNSEGTIIADDGNQKISVDTADEASMNDFQNYLKDMTEQLKNKGQDVYVYSSTGQEDYSSGNQDSCEASNGTWVVFKNGCAARQAACGEENTACSNIQSETEGCLCPKGSCLQYGKCVDTPANYQGSDYDKEDSDGDGIIDTSDHCPNTPPEEKVDKNNFSSNRGCSCSQIPLESRSCPVSRCEGSSMVNYSEANEDECLDGKIIVLSLGAKPSPLGDSFKMVC